MILSEIKRFVKIVVFFGGIIIICSILLTMCGFFVIGEDAGQTGSYIENNNKTSPSGSTDSSSSKGVEEMSASNSACLSYYKLLSKYKSCWQEYEDEDGNITLITIDDDNAVKDAFGNDKNYFIEPNLLYAMNKYLYDGNYVYPEAFLKPVAYEYNEDDEKYHLIDIVDDDKKVQVDSTVHKKDGTETDTTIKSVSDYGIGSVLRYKEEEKKRYLRGTYVKEDYYDETTGTVKQRSISVPFEFAVDSEIEHVIETAITFAGVVDFEYEPTSTLTTASESGESVNEQDNVTKILYDTYTVNIYYASGSSGEIIYFDTEEEMNDYCEENELYTPHISTQIYYLYRYRSSDSGIYTDFVKKTSSETRDENTGYLYDYMENFQTYKPVMDRSSDFFKEFSGVTTVGALTSSLVSNGDSTGGSDFDSYYNGDYKDTINYIWDVCITWGFSEEQTAGLIGNMYQESRFNIDALNSSSGAYGLCQWTSGRKEQLFTFASEYHELDTPDLLSEIQFACMEIQGGQEPWAMNQWAGHSAEREVWESSNDVKDIAKAIAVGFERCGETEANYTARENAAEAAYAALHGREPEVSEDEVVIPDNSGSTDGSGGSSSIASATNTMTDEEKEQFYEFFHMTDDIYDGSYTINLYDGSLTSDEADLVIKTANSFINGTTLSEESLRISDQLWSEGYLTDLSNRSIELETDTTSDIFIAEEGEYTWPVSGTTITSGYGPRVSPTAGASSYHRGIDIAATYGEAVRAAKDGTVITSEYGSSGGYWIQIEHEDGTITQYMHNSSLCVEVGDEVVQGQKIAEAGSTGVSTGVHCHFGIIVDGNYANPLNYLTMPGESSN